MTPGHRTDRIDRYCHEESEVRRAARSRQPQETKNWAARTLQTGFGRAALFSHVSAGPPLPSPEQRSMTAAHLSAVPLPPPIDVTVQVLPAMQLLGMRHTGSSSGLRETWRAMLDHAGERGLLSETALLIGVS